MPRTMTMQHPAQRQRHRGHLQPRDPRAEGRVAAGARRRASWRCSAATAPARPTTLRAVSNLLAGERGEVTKGSIELRGERIEKLTTVRHGRARRGAGDGGPALLRAPDDRGEPADRRLHARATARPRSAQTLEKVYAYFPRLKTRRGSQAAYTSGGEQQMCAIGRALMANPKMVLLDEPSMGLAPQIVRRGVRDREAT